MSSLAPQLAGCRMTLAEIIYHLPDHPSLVQSYIWQELDMAPRFPRLHRFLDYWSRNLEGKLHTVRVAQSMLVKPAEFRYTDHALRLH